MTTSIETFGDRSAESAGGRINRLSEQVRTLRTRAAGANLDRLLLIAGGTLMPVGVLLIILGWVGAARTPLPFEQNDYLISGGILGLALVFAGGFIYFAYWQTIRIRESRVQSRQLTDALARVETLLAGGTITNDDGTIVAAEAPERTLVATPNGSIFHRADCAAVADRTDLKRVNAETTKLKPCRICTPLDD
jgi:hypothetical protein